MNDGSTEDAELDLLRRFEPIVRFNAGEYFLPASVEAFVARSELWERTGPSTSRLLAPATSLDLDRLVELSDGKTAEHFLRLVATPLRGSELLAWHLRRDRPRFRAETRLGRVGVLPRLVDAGARLSLLARGRVPKGAEAAAAVLDWDRPDHGEHPYYGRVLRSAGYVVLQYWFFSFFNDWRSRAHGVNDHEGDWEQVTIYLAEDDDGVVEPAWVAFSAHDEQGPDLRRRWDDPDLQLVDGHPVVHAGLGSHAGSVLPGEYLVTVRSSRYSTMTGVVRRISRFLKPWMDDDDQGAGLGIPYVEYARGDGVSVGPGADRPWTATRIDDDTPWVTRYTGLWGNDTNDRFGGERGPAGPRFERDGTVRRSWSDPVGWAALDSVAPNEGERNEVVTARIAELSLELGEIEERRDAVRARLRADAIGASDQVPEVAHTLEALTHRSADHRAELERLQLALSRPPVPEHPHAHLRHRAVPIPVESRERRRLLRWWATISTPLVFAMVALLLVPFPASTWVIGAAGLVGVFGVEALTRGRFLAFFLRLVGLVVALGLAALVVVALAMWWRYTVAAISLLVAVIFLVLNLRETRRT